MKNAHGRTTTDDRPRTATRNSPFATRYFSGQAIRRGNIRLLLAVFVLLAAVYSVIVPPFETPDEIWHYAFIQHLVTERSLPVSEPHTQALWRQQGVQAPGYYLAAALITAAVDQSDFPAIYARANPHAAIGRPGATINHNYLIHHADERWPWRGAILALHLARFFSIFLSAVTIYAVYRTLRALLDADRALLGAAFVAFIPQFIFISAAASNDNAIDAAASLVLWRLVEMLGRQKAEGEGKSGLAPVAPHTANPHSPDHPVTPSPRHLVILGLLLGFALLAKLSSLALVSLAGLVILWLAWRVRSWRLLIDAALWSGLPALLIAGWWYVRNWRLYGDPLAWNIWKANILLRVIPADGRMILGELGSLERSFWGLFGWLNLPYPEWIYMSFRGVEILLLAGLTAGLLRTANCRFRRRDTTHSQFTIHNSPFTIIPLLWLFLLILSWLRFMVIAPAAQGRYFFPAATALGLLFVWAVDGWGKRLGRVWSWGVVGGLCLLSAATPLWLIRPAYQLPAMPPAQANESLASFGVDGAQIELVGASATAATLHPGDAATVHLAWRSRAPLTTDYSIFLHLVDAAGLTIAQLDTMPGGGLRPTSGWEVGTVLREEYAVTIPATVYTPNQARWQVGLYDQRSGQRLPRLDASGDSYTFDRVSVDAAGSGSIPNPLNVHFADNISLVGYRFDRRVLRPGDEMTVTLYWQARSRVGGEYTIFAHALDDTLQMHGGQDLGPVPATDHWQVGAVVESMHTFVLSPDAPPGLYQFEIGLYTQPDFRRLRLLDAAGAEGADRFLLGPVRVQ